LQGCEPLRGSGFSHERKCKQTCHQAGLPAGGSNPGLLPIKKNAAEEGVTMAQKPRTLLSKHYYTSEEIP
jgi:hypothetical protein